MLSTYDAGMNEAMASGGYTNLGYAALILRNLMK